MFNSLTKSVANQKVRSNRNEHDIITAINGSVANQKVRSNRNRAA